ncbi:MAG: RAD55 family ATPase [Candidatus Hydrothermarchaeales archaeon]
MRLSELQILHIIQKDYETFRKLRTHLSNGLFLDTENRGIYQAITILADRYSHAPTWSEIRQFLYERTDDADRKRAIRRTVRKIDAASVHPDYVSDLIYRERQKADMRSILQEEVLPALDSPDPLPMERIKEKLSDIAEGGTNQEPNYFDPKQIQYPDPEDAVPTGLEGLDSALRGGLFPGELGLIIGVPEEGKTLLSIGFSVAGAISGRRVYFFTLDETGPQLAHKFILRSTGKEEKATKLPRYLDLVRIIDRSGGCSIDDLSSFLFREGTPGLVIVDAGDQLLPSIKRKERRFELGEVYDSFLKFSRQFKVPTWVTTHATIKSSQFSSRKLLDISEAKLEKSKVASVILFLIKQDDPQLLRIRVGKARRPPGRRSFLVRMDSARQLMMEEK